MSAVDTVRRLLVLVPWLLERPGAHVDEAAEAVGVDRATLLSDLGMLDLCGLPGRLGGDLFETQLVGDRILLRLAPAFERPLRPTPTEALRLVLSLDSVAAVLGDDLPGLTGAVARLRELAGIPAGVHVVGDAAATHLDEVRAALADGSSLHLAYAGRGDEAPRQRHVDPWELVLHRGEWYLHAHDRDVDQPRTFRLDRVASVDRAPEAIEVPRPDGELPPPRYVPGEGDVRVELLVRPEGEWVLDQVTPEVRRTDDDGTVRAVVATDATSWVVRLVLAAGGAVEVVAPAAVRATVADAARRGLASHDAGPAAG